MIGHLRGRAIDSDVIETDDGVGYVVRSVSPLEEGTDVSLHIHTTVRENDISLWGFSTRVEREVFRALIAVSGIGPTHGLAVLRTLGVGGLAGVVAAEDVDAFKPVPGVGPALARRILASIRLPEGLHGAPTADTARVDELTAALRDLGYSPTAGAEAAVEVVRDNPGRTMAEHVQLAIGVLAAGGRAA